MATVANILELGLGSEVLVWFSLELRKDKESLSVWGSGPAAPQVSCGKHVTILLFIKINLIVHKSGSLVVRSF